METNDITPLPPLRCSDTPSAIFRVAEDLQSSLAPALWCIHEWTNYQFVHEGADRLKVGSEWVFPIFPNSFQLHFANQLGLTSITPYRGTVPLAAPLYVEVLARKFTTPQDSVYFLRALLIDLFAHMASLPFKPVSSTTRRVRESHQPPNDLFVFHFFRHHAHQMIRGIQAILGRPHQVLDEVSAMVRPHEVRRIDLEAMLGLLKSATASTGSAALAATGSPIARLRPERIWQRLPVETFDTPENRFILTACRRMYLAIDRLQRQKWYRVESIPIPESDRQQIASVRESLAMLVSDNRFATLEQTSRIPGQSRVLQRRDGYRELTVLWHLFQRARKPIFEHLQHAIDLRDIAELYEMWVLFELRTKIQAITGVEGNTSDEIDQFGAPGGNQRTTYPGYGTLHFRKRYTGYSDIPLFPDYTWELPDGDLVALDAKFRMTNLFGSATESDDSEPGTAKGANVKNDDLQKMHTYRDAIPRVKAAIALYPGTTSHFRDPLMTSHIVTLEDIIAGNIDGIGSIPMRPVTTPTTKTNTG